MIRRISRRSVCLLICDAGAIFAAFLCGSYLRRGALDFQYVVQPIVWLSCAALIGAFYIFDLYSPFKYFKPAQTAIEIFYSVFVGSLILAAISYFDRTFSIARPIFVLAVGFSALFVFCVRLLYTVLFRFRLFDKRTVIIGTGSLAYEIAKLIRRTSHSGLNVLGLVGVESHQNLPSAPQASDSTSSHHLFAPPLGGIGLSGQEQVVESVYTQVVEPATHRNPRYILPLLGTTSDLLSLVSFYDIQLVVLAAEHGEGSSESDLMRALFRQPVQVMSAIQLFEKLEKSVPCRLVNEHYVLTLIEQAKTKPYLKVKRMLDILLSLLLFVFLLPVLIMTVLLLSFQDVRRIFFVQKRIGKNRHPFQLIKFRSMIETSDGKKVISGLGEWLRKYRIDELPQMVNVLKGDMSLVGPRPETDQFIERSYRYIPSYHALFAVKPGITGWAQVNFKHTTSERGYEKKFCYDLYYLKNFSLALDLSVLLKTIGIIILGKGR